MKTIIKLFVSSMLVSSAFAATTLGVNSGTFVNPNFTSGGLILNTDGTSLGGVGRFAVVYATSGSITITPGATTAAQLLAQLSLASGVNNMTLSLLNGTLTTVDPGNTQVGKQMLILVGNNTTILSSTAILLYDPNILFPVQVGGNAAAGTAAVRNDSGLLFGSTATATGLGAPFAAQNGTQHLALATIAPVPIPETSTSLLGAIGALALLRRRRNA